MKKNRSNPAFRSGWKKLFFMMRIIVFFLIVGLVEVSASVYSQQTNLNIQLRNAKVEDVFKNIEDQSNFYFLYRSDLLKDIPAATINLDDAKVEEILDQIIVPHGFTYEIDDRIVVIKKAGEPTVSVVPLMQEIKVTGVVSDDTGAPLPGVSVAEKGTTNGTITDFDGNYEITVSNGNAILVYSFVGMIAQEVPVEGKSSIDVVLQESLIGIEEVIAIGYGQTQNKRTISTALNKVDSRTIEQLSVGQARPELVLQGSTPGVTVQQNSGSPGSPLTVRIRGAATAGGAQPLYLVDGVQVPNLTFLNSADIEDISILKDAAAAAIYGARGANGVVLVQTRRGKIGDDRLQVSIEAYTGIQNLANTPDLMNRDQYVDYYNEFATNFNANEPNPDNHFGLISDADRAKLEDTDWYDQVLTDNAAIHSTSISVTDGNDRISYYLSGGIISQDGLVGGDEGKSKYVRKNVKLNVDMDLFDNLSIKVGADLVRTERDYLDENSAGTGTAILNYIPALPSIYPAFDENGLPYDMGQFGRGVINGVTMPFSGVGAVTNPYVALTNQNNNVISDLKMFNVAANWEVVKNLDVNTSFAYYEDISEQRSFFKSYDYRPEGHELYNETADYTEMQYKNWYSQWEGNVQYKFEDLGEHSLDVMGGFSVLESYGSSKGMSGSDFYVNDFNDVNFALIKDISTVNNFKPDVFETGLFSLYARANYNYKFKYLFAATIRSDASSKFSDDNRTGVFPSFSAGWVLSEEDFMSDSEKIDLFKIRASWGINGNDNINNYQYSRLLSAGTGPAFGGANTPGISNEFLANSKVKWEEVSQTNIGLDINMFNNSLGITLDYYDKKTSDMLVPIGTPRYIGKTSAAANVADVKNSGVEAMISYKKSHGNGFKWNVDLNVGYNKNEVSSLGENGQPLQGGNIGFIFSDPITRTDIGHPIASFYGFEVESVGADGEFVFKDNDGVSGISDADKTFIGKPTPDFTVGVNLGAEYKGFDFSAFIYSSQGNDIYDATTRLDAPFANRPVSYLEAGAPGNLLGGATGTSQTAVSDFYVKDGSFTKVKNVTIGYSLPKKVISPAKLSKVRFYVTAQNLFTITDYDGVDPEIGQAFAETVLDIGIDRGFYPQPRTFIFGIQAKF